MDKETQLYKLCRVCGFEREYDEYHRLYAACENCGSIRCAKHYQKNTEKTLKNVDFIGKTLKKKLNKAVNQLTHTPK